MQSRFVIWPQEVTLARWTQPSGPLCLWQCFHYLTTMAQQPVPRTLFYVFSADVSTAPKEGRIYPCKDILLDVILSSIPQSQHLKDPLVDIGCHRNAFTGSCIGKCNVREARLSSGLLVLCPPAAVGRRSVRQAGRPEPLYPGDEDPSNWHLNGLNSY